MAARVPKVSGFLFGGRRRRSFPLALLHQTRVTVEAPLLNGPVIQIPDQGFRPLYATNLHQRMLCEHIHPLQHRRSILIDGAIYSTTDAPPNESATWSLVAGTELGASAANLVRYVAHDQALFTGLTFIGLWTWVNQNPRDWFGPFSVVHELWGNAFRFSRDEEDFEFTVKGTPLDQVDQGIVPQHRTKRSGEALDGFH